jgi:hypothetical protein
MRAAHKPEDISRWMGKVIFVRKRTLTERHAARDIKILFGKEYVSARGNIIAEPIREALRELFPHRLRWDRKRKRWSADRSTAIR